MRSAEVGIWDELVRTGARDVERQFPLVLGLGGAGTIIAVGTHVKGFAAGQYVYVYSYPLADNGSWAEYVLVPDNYVARAPASITPCATDYEHNAVLRRKPDGKWETVVHDARLLWPDTMSVAADGYVYVTANQLHRQARFHGGQDLRRKPYSLFRTRIDARPVELR